MSDTTVSREPQFSPDRQWWWTGTSWVPAASVASPSLLTFGAFACVGLALLAYVLLPTFVLSPVASIFAIHVGRGVFHSLPKTATRDRWMTGIGIGLAVIPLALIILGICAFMLFGIYATLTGHNSIP